MENKSKNWVVLGLLGLGAYVFWKSRSTASKEKTADLGSPDKKPDVSNKPKTGVYKIVRDFCGQLLIEKENKVVSTTESKCFVAVSEMKQCGVFGDSEEYRCKEWTLQHYVEATTIGGVWGNKLYTTNSGRMPDVNNIQHLYEVPLQNVEYALPFCNDNPLSTEKIAGGTPCSKGYPFFEQVVEPKPAEPIPLWTPPTQVEKVLVPLQSPTDPLKPVASQEYISKYDPDRIYEKQRLGIDVGYTGLRQPQVTISTTGTGYSGARKIDGVFWGYPIEGARSTYTITANDGLGTVLYENKYIIKSGLLTPID